MPNARRGDVEAVLDGRKYTLRLTLGALAELEDAFGATDLVGLAARFEEGRLSARDLLRIIAAGLRGGGAILNDEDVAKLACHEGLDGYIRIASRLLAVTFGEPDPEGASAHPPEPQDA